MCKEHSFSLLLLQGLLTLEGGIMEEIFNCQWHILPKVGL